MTDIVPAPEQRHEPLRPAEIAQAGIGRGSGEAPSFMALAKEFIALATAAARISLKMAHLVGDVKTTAAHTDHLAELITVDEYDPKFVAEVQEAAADMRGMLDDARSLEGAAQELDGAARATARAHEAEYGGIKDVHDGSRHRMPKPGALEAE